MEAGATEQTKSPEQLAREAFDALNRHDLSRAEDFWGPNSVGHFLPMGEYRGTEAIAGFFESLIDAMPDLSIEVERILTASDWTTVQWRMRGTFTGQPFLGFDATGRPIDIRGVDVTEWRNGRVAHNTIYFDGAEFARQVGLLPPRDSVGDRAITTAFNAVTRARALLKEQFG
jgi:steroid delta-isomerase-like uncharacterized protein